MSEPKLKRARNREQRSTVPCVNKAIVRSRRIKRTSLLMVAGQLHLVIDIVDRLAKLIPAVDPIRSRDAIVALSGWRRSLDMKIIELNNELHNLEERS